MKKLLLIAVIGAVLFYLNRRASAGAVRSGVRWRVHRRRFSAQQSGALVTGQGQVSRILGDDSIGDHHQRFILRLPSGQTVLIAHNVDIAPRIEGLNVGDTVSFHGEFEWNDKGGVVHWTHHDPQGSHECRLAEARRPDVPVNDGDDGMDERDKPDHDPARRSLLRQSLALAGMAALASPIGSASAASAPAPNRRRIRIRRSGAR